jgi:hypothetical protein
MTWIRSTPSSSTIAAITSAHWPNVNGPVSGELPPCPAGSTSTTWNRPMKCAACADQSVPSINRLGQNSIARPGTADP